MEQANGNFHCENKYKVKKTEKKQRKVGVLEGAGRRVACAEGEGERAAVREVCLNLVLCFCQNWFQVKL